ncbi:MAG: hypothetical protein CL779_03160 [Chloroflexi bacterium]|nr:hypothetical protein [Chloroflexota bacterium]|tara:strand:+ start:523 stop:756 length:234 start_codon:yes stop_codon:yes gene_type:complete
MDNIVIYLSIKRGFIFLDEWLSYYLLYNLLYSSNYYMFFIASILAIIFNGYGYKSYWEIEERYNEYLINKINKIDDK